METFRCMAVRWSKEQYEKWFPQYNRDCPICHAVFNALFVGRKDRVTCSKKCSDENTTRVQRENTKAYIKGEKYKAYKRAYYDKKKAERMARKEERKRPKGK